MPVLMELNKIIIKENVLDQIIVLKEVNGERRFPIVIGDTEANAIKRRLEGFQMPRPMTHDLLANVIEVMGGKLDRIEIVDLADRTFFARLFIKQDGQIVEADSRPSDAIALGIANSVPIYVAEHVLDAVCG